MIIVEYRTGGSLLKRAFERAPAMIVHSEAQYLGDETSHYILSAEGDDFENFEDGIEADPSVTSYELLSAMDSRRLYRMTAAKPTHDTSTLSEWKDLNLVFLEGVGTREGWELRVGFPDHEALTQFRSLYRERELPFRLQKIYHESDVRDGGDTGLTDAQRDALVTAHEAGFFDVPQRVTQADVAKKLGISPQALSERLQRGIYTLVDTNLITE